MDGVSMPGAFPDGPEESVTNVQRTPKRRFIGRRTFEAEQKLKQSNTGSVEETTAVVKNGK